VLSRVVSQRTGPYGEVLGNNPSPLKCHKLIIIIEMNHRIIK
jgi:hypothetical protein